MLELLDIELKIKIQILLIITYFYFNMMNEIIAKPNDKHNIKSYITAK